MQPCCGSSLAATETPAADVAAKLAGPFGAKAISFLIVVSTFGFMNLALLSAPRVYYAMGVDGVFFKSLGRLSPRFQAPTAAILLQGVLASIFAVSNQYDELVRYMELSQRTIAATNHSTVQFASSSFLLRTTSGRAPVCTSKRAVPVMVSVVAWTVALSA